MQYVRLVSGVTYDVTHVTPSSALFSTTPPQVFAPSTLVGMLSPSANVRSTRYRGIAAPLVDWNVGGERTAVRSGTGRGVVERRWSAAVRGGARPCGPVRSRSCRWESSD